MSECYFLGDPHFGHKGITRRFRKGFSSDEEHDNYIHDQIMNCCGPNNQLWLLGDILFHPSHFRKLWEYSLSFQNVNIVLGNHDNHELVEYCIQYGIKVYGLTKRYGFWLSHAPLHSNELYGRMNVHGHVHDNTVLDDRYINVSCEAIDYKPISLNQLRNRISS